MVLLSSVKRNTENMSKKISIESNHNKRIINSIAEIIYYGIMNNRHIPNNINTNIYKSGSFETLAHITSCCLVQWLGLDSCMDSDVIFFFNFEKMATQRNMVSISQIEKKIIEFVNNS